LVGDDNSFFGFLEALRDNNLAKVLAEPTLVTVSGRPASFNAGGEFPILVPQSLGTISIEYKQFGTRVDFVPIVLGNGSVRLEVRPQVSELDNANGVTLNGNRIPGLRTRWVDTAVEMRAGQTLALAGLIQTRVEAQNRGIPWLADLPWAGAAFRRVEEQQNEIELVVTVRPELVDALDPHEVPACLPGTQSTSPTDCELYFRGYIEVPNCCTDGSCPNCQGRQLNGQTITEGPIPTPATPADSAAPAATEAVPSPDSSTSNPARRPFHYTAQRQNVGRAGSISGRQIRPSTRSPQAMNSSDDPGLFGRVGYDVLDYKE
jgi:pilus assembly protein CpaC